MFASRQSCWFAIGFLAASALWGMPAPLRAGEPHTYEQGLVGRTIARHPQIKDLVLWTGTTARPGQLGDPNPAYRVQRQLDNSAGAALGTVTVVFAVPAASVNRANAATLAKIADQAAFELSRHIFVASNLSDPEPFEGDHPLESYAQSLVDQAIESDGDLITLAIHATPPGQPDNIIVASNFGRIGKKADRDDLGIIRTGKPVEEVTSGGRRLAIELPLLDISGRTIGALSTSYKMASETEKAELRDKAVRLRDSLGRRIRSPAQLAGPAIAP